MMRRQRDERSRALYELSALVLSIIRSPPAPVNFSDDATAVPATESVRRTRRSASMQQITPAGFASLLLGISLALMMCGSVTFFLGFLLMPWVLGLVLVFYVAAVFSGLSMIGRSILCHSSLPRKDVNSWKL